MGQYLASPVFMMQTVRSWRSLKTNEALHTSRMDLKDTGLGDISFYVLDRDDRV